MSLAAGAAGRAVRTIASSPGPAATPCAAGLFALATAAAAPPGNSGIGPPLEARGAAHIEGPPPGHTGGFGEPTCAACHIGAPLNEPGSTLQVLGLEEGYRPGQRHPVTIRLESFDMGSAGFQASFRFDGGERRGARAGEIRPLDDQGTVARTDDGGTADGGTEYVQHTRAGSRPTDDVAAWTFEWHAPETEAPIVLHVAANSGSGDDSPLDDLVYTLSIAIAPAAPRPAREPDSR
ncbi:choice-of-anchor V domain-containing protein [Candidatus Palauibacter sp.]|uniref:choice-of-anchor V domain-containing protein n=1 Tax=Candidatus Palauibacter sp. TaxID=3101350 RepID=UPI003CC658BC